MNRLFDELSGDVISCALDVHRELGPGFVEKAYHSALRIALTDAGLGFVCESRVVVRYRGVDIGIHQLDLLVKGELIVELKAVKCLTEIHYAQLRSYLRAANLRVGLLINFNAPKLEVRRLVNRYQDILVSPLKTLQR